MSVNQASLTGVQNANTVSATDNSTNAGLTLHTAGSIVQNATTIAQQSVDVWSNGGTDPTTGMKTKGISYWQNQLTLNNSYADLASTFSTFEDDYNNGKVATVDSTTVKNALTFLSDNKTGLSKALGSSDYNNLVQKLNSYLKNPSAFSPNSSQAVLATCAYTQDLQNGGWNSSSASSSFPNDISSLQALSGSSFKNNALSIPDSMSAYVSLNKISTPTDYPSMSSMSSVDFVSLSTAISGKTSSITQQLNETQTYMGNAIQLQDMTLNMSSTLLQTVTQMMGTINQAISS